MVKNKYFKILEKSFKLQIINKKFQSGVNICYSFYLVLKKVIFYKKKNSKT